MTTTLNAEPFYVAMARYEGLLKIDRSMLDTSKDDMGKEWEEAHDATSAAIGLLIDTPARTVTEAMTKLRVVIRHNHLEGTSDDIDDPEVRAQAPPSGCKWRRWSCASGAPSSVATSPPRPMLAMPFNRRPVFPAGRHFTETTMTINAALFAEAGEALFGPEWKLAVANLIGMDVRRVRRIAKAAREGVDYPVHETLGPILAGHLKERARTAQSQAVEAARLAKLLE